MVPVRIQDAFGSQREERKRASSASASARARGSRWRQRLWADWRVIPTASAMADQDRLQARASMMRWSRIWPASRLTSAATRAASSRFSMPLVSAASHFSSARRSSGSVWCLYATAVSLR
jgi:hypothetical protein